MTTSGSTDFSATRNQIVSEAFQMGGIVRADQALSGPQLAKGARALNSMVKVWQIAGIHVWTIAEGTLIPQASQLTYDLGSTSTDHVMLTSELVQTALAADAADGAGTITVDDDTGIADTNKVGVVVDDGTIHWTTVNGTPAANVVTLTAALDDSATTDAVVFAYANKLVRPLRIVNARRKNLASGQEVPLGEPMGRIDYLELTNKSADGVPVAYFYDAQITLGKLSLYQRETSISEIVNFTYHRPIEDFDAASDNPDLPQEWIDALQLGLALRLAISYDIPEQRYARIKEQFAAVMLNLAGNDRDEGSVFMVPDLEDR